MNHISPSELGAFLDAVASAPVALRDVPRINSILARLVGLANSRYNIGELREPSVDEQSPASEKAGSTD